MYVYIYITNQPTKRIRLGKKRTSYQSTSSKVTSTYTELIYRYIIIRISNRDFP